MSKRMKIVVIVLLILFIGTFIFDLIRHFMIKMFFAHFQLPPVAVATTTAVTKDWQPRLNSIGSTVAVNGVELTSQVAGQITGIFFTSGQMVQKGQPLLQLDDAIDRQTLFNNEAELTLDQLNFQRMSSLIKRNAISKNDFDVAQSKLLQAKSAVATAKLNIEYKNIKAPFSGKIGLRKVNLGEYITPGQGLVSLESLDPLYIDFSLPQQDLPSLKEKLPVELTVDIYPGEKFMGAIDGFDSKVDINTRTVAVRAIVPNQNNRLYPGLFANVTVLLPIKTNVMVVPLTAVSYNLYGDIVYVVSQQGKNKKGQPILVAKQRFVGLGERRDNEVQVLKGLKVGEQVVTAGQIKLHEGSQVVVNNKINVID